MWVYIFSQSKKSQKRNGVLSRRPLYLLVFVVGFMVSGCTLGSDDSSSAAPSQLTESLSFDKSSYQVLSGSSTEAIVSISNDANSTGSIVSLSSSNTDVLKLSESQCVLSSNSGSIASCEFSLIGLTNGTATITASEGNVSTTATVTVSSTAVPGTLAFTPSSAKITDGSVRDVTLSLNGSSGVSNLVVNLTSTIVSGSSAGVKSAKSVSPMAASIDSITPSTCILSTENRTCDIRIKGTNLGQAVIKATVAGSAASQYSVAQDEVEIVNYAIPGTLGFDGNVQISKGSSKSVALKLKDSSGVSGLAVTLKAQNAYVTLSTTTCTLSSVSPVCYVDINGTGDGLDTITASASGYSDASMIANVTGGAVPGSFYFKQSSETIDINDTYSLALVYSGGTGVSGLDVSIAADNTNITVSPSSCLMSNTNGSSTCDITIDGVSEGTSVVTASAAGYASATNTVTVKQGGGDATYGTLGFMLNNAALSTLKLDTNNTVPVTLEMDGSSNVDGLSVTLASSDSTVLSTSSSACVLSTVSNSCSFKVTSLKTGTATLTASSAHGSASFYVTVTTDAKPFLVYSPTYLTLSNQSTGASGVTVTLINPSSDLSVNIKSSDQSAMGISPGAATLSASSRSVSISNNNAVVGAASGSYQVTVTPTDPSVSPISYTVNIASPVAVDRLLTVVNRCPYTVYAGISGGSVGASNPTSQSDCPSGSTFNVDVNACYWNNPAPSTGSYQLDSNASATFTIPKTNSNSVADKIWSGGVMARIRDVDGNWTIGDCTGDNNKTQYDCNLSKSFATPSTVAEFTLLRSSADAYDVTVINGVTVPTLMRPANASYDLGTPYTNGAAGGTTDQNGSTYVLNAASWEFNPANTASPDAKYFNYVTDGGAECTNAVCASSSDVCGYTPSTLANKQFDKVYCGKRLGYLTAQEIWSKENNTSNNAPGFNFSTPVPTGPAGYQYLGYFYGCPYDKATNTGFPSGFTGTPSDNPTESGTTCGCTEWEGVAHNSQKCATYSNTWVDNVLPNTKWVKMGCPTCYSYQYDDMASTFSGFTSASTSNPVNGVNYEIIFCPDGKDFTNRPSYMQ